MNFNSLAYYIFLPSAVFIYFITGVKYRNAILLILSYFFYMRWRPEYACLIFLSTAITYLCAIFMDKSLFGKRRLWLAANLIINLAILFFFKYFNFFTTLLNDALAFAVPERTNSFTAINVLLPVGISFYTFQALGYTVDVYRKSVPVEKNFINYAVFVSFFPQLVAGPIERSANLLPQFRREHKLSLKNFHEGLLLVLWGLFKKLVIADRLAVLVNFTYGAEQGEIAAAGYIIAAAAFSFQIYCDFSAYSDIARGSARILGFELMENFAAPYFSASVREFWKRWHISLSSWFKDYLYLPLGGSRCSKPRHYLNLMLVFVVSGLWHGASLSFVAWGALNGLYQVIGDFFRTAAKKMKLRCPRLISRTIGCICTFSLVTYAFIFFRAATLKEAFYISGKIFSSIMNFSAESGELSFACITQLGLPTGYLWVLAASLTLLAAVDYISVSREADLVNKISGTVFIKYTAYFILIMSMVILGYYGTAYDPQEFIYFQF